MHEDQTRTGGVKKRVFSRRIRIQGPHDGDLRSEKQVRIESDAIMTGDIVAPQVVVRGLVSGRVLALELLVEEKGQVWGDVWTRSLQVKPGGRVRGWVSELTEPLAEVLVSGQPIPEHIRPDSEDGDAVNISHLYKPGSA